MVELNFSSGDFVRLRLSDKELDGTILENPDSSIFLLKLSSGYNIGILKENVLAGRILKKFKEIDKNYSLPIEKKSQKSIGLIVTGGTIASKLDPKTGGTKPLTNLEEFASFYPEIFKKVNVKKIDIPFMISSESMSSEHWIKIAESVKEMLDDQEIEGVIVTHGTDTLHYTSSALSFFLRNLSKPVVLTYSQRSIDRASSDASLNLECAVSFALSDCAEVVLVGHATSNDTYCIAIRGTKARKMHSSRRDAFKSINSLPIANVYPDKVEFLSSYKSRTKEKTLIDKDFSDKVAILKFYPGQSPDILDYYALKYKGIILEVLGIGQVASSDSLNNWIPSIKKHIRNGLIICACAQTIYGRVDPYVYSNGRELMDAGVIFLEDMLSETALVKLGWILGHYSWKTHIKEKMLENLSGEISDRLFIEE